MIVALDHVQLAIPPGSEARCRPFWCDLMGLAELAKPAPMAARGGAWFGIGGITVHLGVEDPFAPAMKAHPAFRVADLDALARRLTDEGLPVVWDDQIAGVRRFFTTDPVGNRIELIAAP
jgi:catechol 2,3-dioxygenase-like lactoylglutathione lyase family enzyme